MRFLFGATLLLVLAGATAAGDRDRLRAPALPAAPSPNPGTATLPRFALFGWVAPPVDFTTPERYAELANAGLNTTVLAWLDPGTRSENLKRLACSRPVGLHNLLLDLRLDAAREGDPRTPALLDS